MHHTVRTIRVKRGSELDRLLDNVDDSEVQLERNGVRYRVSRLDSVQEIDIWADYDPAVALDGMRRAAGSWSDIDARTLKEELYRAREQGSRPPDR